MKTNFIKNNSSKTSKLKVQTPCVSVPLGDPTAKQFELTLSWLNWLMKIYQKNQEELYIIDEDSCQV